MNKTNRETKQREAIKAALEKVDRPLNVNEILKAAHNTVPNLGIATVYRNVKTMVERGDIASICGSGIAPCYAKADIADLCIDHALYQVGNSLYLSEPKDFVLDCPYKIQKGHIA